jgi:hypothetical protein
MALLTFFLAKNIIFFSSLIWAKSTENYAAKLNEIEFDVKKSHVEKNKKKILKGDCKNRNEEKNPGNWLLRLLYYFFSSHSLLLLWYFFTPSVSLS